MQIEEVQNTKHLHEILANQKKCDELEESTGIYYLIKDKEIVYIGQTKSINTRIKSHIRDSKIEFDHYTFFRLNKEDLNKKELEEILKFKPQHNKKILKNPFFKTLTDICKTYNIKRNIAKEIIAANNIKSISLDDDKKIRYYDMVEAKRIFKKMTE